MAKTAVGIWGGTLDPVHCGHLAMAKAAAAEVGLASVMMLPSGDPPHKSNVTPAAHRWRMLCAACAQEPALIPNRMELDRSGKIYTVDTLRALRAENPEAELYYMIGTDTLPELRNWRSHEEVLKLCTFIVCPRSVATPAQSILEEQRRLEGLGARFVHIHAEPMDVSSTAIREAVRSGSEAPGLPAVCRAYVDACGLYGAPALNPEASVWLERLFGALTVRRFAHTLAVAYTARRLAQAHGLDEQKAEAAALLHDCAKCLPDDEMRKICIGNSLTDDASVLASGALMHAVAGAWLAGHLYGVGDPEILSAIAWHTTGRPGMTPLELIIYLADKIEPTRRPYPGLDDIRGLALSDLKAAAALSLDRTKDYVLSRGGTLHPASAKTLAWLRQDV